VRRRVSSKTPAIITPEYGREPDIVMKKKQSAKRG